MRYLYIAALFSVFSACSLALAGSDHDKAFLKKGPYLTYPCSNTQMTVLWQLDSTSPASISWGTDPSALDFTASTTEYGSDHQHRYTIDNLTPGAKYYYKVSIPTGTFTGSFTAAPPSNSDSAAFFVFGDTRTNPADQDMVTSMMISTYKSNPAFQSIALHSGDWAYSNSENSWSSECFSHKYPHNTELQASLPIAGTFGNHDGKLYLKYWPRPSGRRYYSFDYGPAHIIILDQYTSYNAGSAQYAWLDNDLKTTAKKWKFILLHQPGFSAGGHPNDKNVQARIHPLCVKYGVQVVFGGHNHYYAHALVGGIHHLTVGGGGAPLGNPSSNARYIISACSELSFVKVKISGSILLLEAVKYDGTVLDSFTIQR